MDTKEKNKLIVALDYSTRIDAVALAKQLDPSTCRVKVGKELFTYCGPAIVDDLKKMGFDVFLDMKFHDIPTTVAKAAAAAAHLGVWMLNIHASGGLKMMQAAKGALDGLPSPSKDRPLLIAVTALTSMSAADLEEIGITVNIEQHVTNLAKLALEAGLDGVVCSAREATTIKKLCGPEFKTITPGIRPVGSDTGDQKRVMTPLDAVKSGSDYLVMGRPIIQAADPMQVIFDINKQLASH